MSDNNKHTDPIEELFRRKAEDYDISYREKDWQDMEKRLTALDKDTTSESKWRWLIAASVLIFALLGYFTYENRVQISQLSQQLNNRNTSESQIKPLRENNPAQNIREKNDQSGGSSIHNTDRNGSGSEFGKQADKTANIPSLSSQQMSNAQNLITSGSTEVHAAMISTGNDLHVFELSCPTCVVSERDRDQQLANLGRENVPTAPAGTSSLATEAGIIPLTSREEMQKPGSRVTLSILAGPDMSTVGSFSDFDSPGYKFGITVEYNLTSRLSISTGIIQSDVRYRARGNEYKPPAGYWTDGIVPYETIGECLLLDIPVSLKYRFFDMNHSRIYLGIGLSSYIMQSEDYHFNYREDRSNLVQGWYGDTGTRHWFSNAGFSVGYELDIHPNWSLRAEPFINIPLREVGWGNVKLYSLGNFISINYKL